MRITRQEQEKGARRIAARFARFHQRSAIDKLTIEMARETMHLLDLHKKFLATDPVKSAEMRQRAKDIMMATEDLRYKAGVGHVTSWFQTSRM